MRVLLTVAAILAACACALAAPLDTSREISVIAFGSCAHQDKPQPIWDHVLAAKPDVFLALGDNIYADTEDMAKMRSDYEKMLAVPGYARLREVCPVLATWDDHDFGVNDGGRDYPKRAESQAEFVRVFSNGPDFAPAKRPGVYQSYIFGPEGRRTQIILLDTRYFRSPLKKGQKDAGGGIYDPDESPEATLLGDEQWTWLEGELRRPAELRIIASSIQVVSEDHRFEKWMNFPRERERLFSLIRDTGAEGVLFVSGDRHLAELSLMDAGLGYPVYDVTSSAITQSARRFRHLEVNRRRVATMNWGDNFGLITVDWDRADPAISLQIRDEDGDIRIQQKLSLGLLRKRQ